MIFWLDAQLPPALAEFLTENFDLDAVALRDLGLRDAGDMEIFQLARDQNVILVSKDADFVELIQRMGAPPRLLWVTCGNVSNEYLRSIFIKLLPEALKLFKNGEEIVEIGDMSK